MRGMAVGKYRQASSFFEYDVILNSLITVVVLRVEDNKVNNPYILAAGGGAPMLAVSHVVADRAFRLRGRCRDTYAK